jgi:hypothetical protein
VERVLARRLSALGVANAARLLEKIPNKVRDVLQAKYMKALISYDGL